MRLPLALISALMMSGPVIAGPFDGVFASRPEGCQWLEDEGLSATYEHDLIAMTLADGLVANEYGCEFVDTKPTKGGLEMVIIAMCGYPGEPFPDLISLSQFDDTSIVVTSLHDLSEDAARDAESMWGSQTYTRCDNLKDLPQ